MFFPDYLKSRKIWLLWRLEPDARNPDRMTKIPYRADSLDKRASSTNPDTWTSYKGASCVFKNNPGRFDGIGITVNIDDRLVFIDVDHCYDDSGHLTDTAQLILSAFPDCFAERSQSGTGLHILALGQIPRSFKNSSAGVEMYSTGRFIALTGDAIQEEEPRESQEALLTVYDKFKPPERKTVQREAAAESTLLPHEVLAHAMGKSPKFRDVFAGSWQQYFGSQSEADLYACGALAFWSDCDPAAIDAAFRQSGLMRPKWDEHRGAATYGERTIRIAVSGCMETLTEYRIRRKREERAAIWKAWEDF